ncbi:MAG: amidohydrolase family protein [Novosphingobium sp.]|nr:amidohydrolase family protein [Novosphingobium sp.]MCP5402848.1 amidohydrolase family protein [Novosphingobium sp.]
MLIRNAEVWNHGVADVRLADGLIAGIGQLSPEGDETVIEAAGGALLPGLHDHHIHLAGLAVRASSVICGPPEATCEEELRNQLQQPGKGWIRGIMYHESVMGLPDAAALDTLVAERPLRIQHRSGRMWLLNSAALDALLENAEPPPGLEQNSNGFTGRLFDEDRWLQDALGSRPPDLSEVSASLASFGVTGITDMTPANGPEMASHFSSQHASGALAQRCWLAGTLGLVDAPTGAWHVGPVKLHLHEAALPAFEDAVGLISAAHRQGRPVAIHCVSEVELVFALAALEEAGISKGDRIEHASVASLELVDRIAALDIHVCAQPQFVEERGDRYLEDVETRHLPDLYRLRSLAEAGICLAGGSDAPFASPDPWAAMAAAVSRTTREGREIGPDEALTPEEALALYLKKPGDLSQQQKLAPGQPADLCLLVYPWKDARTRLSSGDVRATIVSGRLVHDLVDEAP